MYNLIPKTMAKIYGLQGVLSGKLGNSVFAVRNGEQIARQFQPVVSNPSTSAQVGARAKLKLMSQLSAVMAPVIAIPRRGSVSSRNIFVKKNYGLSTFANNNASVELVNVQLTDSVVAFPVVSIARRENGIGAAISYLGENLDVNRVVYALFEKQTDDKLRFVSSSVVSEPGELNNYATTLPLINNAVVVYAYGIRDNSNAARAVFGDMQAPTAENVAKLITSRVLTSSDVTLTETRAAALNAV